MKPYYDDGRGIVIYHGDCRQILPQLSADLLCTDPPYGIGAARNERRNTQYGKALAVSRDYGVADWDDERPPDWIFGLMREVTEHQVIFGGNYFPLPPSRCWLVWDKQNGDNGYADCELAWTNFDKAVRRIVWRWHGMLRENDEVRWHPTQKPENVMRWAIQHAPEACNSVLDPFMGVGTTLIAAKALGKSAIGIEIEEKYCEIAAKRLSQQVFNFEPSAAEPHPEQLQL